MNLKDLRIEKAKIQDMNELVELNKEEYWGSDDHPNLDELFNLGKWWVIPTLLQWHRQIIQNCNGEILIAKYKNEIIAELDYVLSTDFVPDKIKRIHIIWLIVKGKYRKNGIAKLLIEKLKIKFHNIEIWVEAEDERSLRLYSSIGNKRRTITNWILKIKNNRKNILFGKDLKSLKSISYDELLDDVKNFKLYPIIGRYYAPIFDLEQLRSSDDVYPYIWGNTEKSIIQVYQYNSLKIVVILTQYLRIYVEDENFSRNDFQNALNQIMDDIFKYGFEEIYAQIYSEDNIDAPLTDIGFSMADETDNVFML